MKLYQKINGIWYAAPAIKTRKDIIREWVKLDLLPLLFNPGSSALEETLKVYLSVTDEEIEKCKKSHSDHKKGKFKEKPKKKGDIPVHPDAPREQYVSPLGYRLGDYVLLKNGNKVSLDRMHKAGSFAESKIFGHSTIVSEEDIAEVLVPAPVLHVGEVVTFKNSFDGSESTAPIEAFVRNADLVFVYVVRDGRKIPVSVGVKTLKNPSTGGLIYEENDRSNNGSNSTHHHRPGLRVQQVC